MQVPLELIEKVSQVVFLKIKIMKLAFHHEFVELCLQWCSFLAIKLDFIQSQILSTDDGRIGSSWLYFLQ